MTRVVFMAKETFSSVRALLYLCKSNEIKVVGAIVRKRDSVLRKICKENDIKVFTEEELRMLYAADNINVDYILSFYWKKVKEDILGIPKSGSINFHPGPLPEARGSGYHIAILENWGYFGVTAHYMDTEFDTGEIIECRRFKIDENVLNIDLVRMTHEHLYWLFVDIMQQIINGNELSRLKQTEGRYFSLCELEQSKLIQPEESIDDIDRKIRAFWNPPYSGAQIEIKGKKYTVVDEGILNWIALHIKNQY